jgi:endo-1,4-beta-D-glucanase Y
MERARELNASLQKDCIDMCRMYLYAAIQKNKFSEKDTKVLGLLIIHALYKYFGSEPELVDYSSSESLDRAAQCAIVVYFSSLLSQKDTDTYLYGFFQCTFSALRKNREYYEFFNRIRSELDETMRFVIERSESERQSIDLCISEFFFPSSEAHHA